MQDKPKKIIFLTSTNLASNPRCRKEVELACEQGYEVVVYAFEMQNWTNDKEIRIRESLNGVQYYSIQAGRKPVWPWLLSVIAGKVAKILYRAGIRTAWVNGVGVDKKTFLLIRAIRQTKPFGNLVIAHNPGALYPAWRYAQSSGIPYAVDIEDYYPGEGDDPVIQNMNTGLLKKILPAARYITYASECFIKKINELSPGMENRQQDIINNVFCATDFPVPVNDNTEKLQLVWFSQNIDRGRGLEQVLEVFDAFSEKINLVLIGNPKSPFVEEYLQQRTYVKIIESLPQEELHKTISRYDIGLAIEPGRDLNNRLALSNKIWTYFQSGLYILASNTESQAAFINRFGDHGKITTLQKEPLSETMSYLVNNREKIRSDKKLRRENAQQYSWEHESQKLLRIWKMLS